MSAYRYRIPEYVHVALTTSVCTAQLHVSSINGCSSVMKVSFVVVKLLLPRLAGANH